MELIKNLIALKEQSDNIVELTTFKGNTIPSSAWTDGVLYKGLNVYKTVYEDRPQILSDTENELIQYSRSNKLEMQESYLGYSPSQDIFIQGYDGWLTIEEDDEEGNTDTTTDNCSPYILFKIMENGSIKVIDSGEDFGAGKIWYSSSGPGGPGGYKTAKKKYPDLIDIRLD